MSTKGSMALRWTGVSFWALAKPFQFLLCIFLGCFAICSLPKETTPGILGSQIFEETWKQVLMLRQNEWHGVYLFIHCHFVSVIVFVRFSFDLLRFNVFCFSYLASLISNTVEVIKIKFCLSSIRKRIMHFSFFFLPSKWLTHLPWHSACIWEHLFPSPPIIGRKWTLWILQWICGKVSNSTMPKC